MPLSLLFISLSFAQRCHWRVLFAALLVCHSLAAQTRAAGSAPAKGGIPGYIVLPLGRGHNNRLVFMATVEGTKGLMMLDTGASGSLLSSSKYGSLLKEPNRKSLPGRPGTVSMNGVPCPFIATRDYIVAGQDLGPVAAAVVPSSYMYDTAALYDAQPGRQHDGLLGENVLRRARAVVDCGHLVLYLNVNPAKQFHLGAELTKNGWTRIPMSDLHGSDFTVPCEINGHKFRLVVDTGAPLTVLDRDRLRGAGVGARDLPMKGGVIGTQAEQTGLADTRTLQIGNYSLGSTYLLAGTRAARIFESISGDGTPLLGFLGGDVLARNAAFIDIGEHALYLKQAATKQP